MLGWRFTAKDAKKTRRTLFSLLAALLLCTTKPKILCKLARIFFAFLLSAETWDVRKDVGPASSRHKAPGKIGVYMPARRRRYDSSTRSRRTRSIVSSFFLRELRGREKKFKIRRFHARKLLKTLGRFCNFLFFLTIRVSAVRFCCGWAALCLSVRIGGFILCSLRRPGRRRIFAVRNRSIREVPSDSYPIKPRILRIVACENTLLCLRSALS